MLVACVYVQGNVPFTVDYVRRLRDAVRRNLQRPHRFVCLTDRPTEVSENVPGCEYIHIQSLPRGLPGWWSKLELFNPSHQLTGPGLYLDLDVIVVDKLDPIVDYPAHTMALVPPAGRWLGRNGLTTVRRYNSSVIKFASFGLTPELYCSWTQQVARRLWGDQDWIGEQRRNEKIMPIEWFPRLSELTAFSAMSGTEAQTALRNTGAKVVLCKKPKNTEAAAMIPWVKELW